MGRSTLGNPSEFRCSRSGCSTHGVQRKRFPRRSGAGQSLGGGTRPDGFLSPSGGLPITSGPVPGRCSGTWPIRVSACAQSSRKAGWRSPGCCSARPTLTSRRSRPEPATARRAALRAPSPDGPATRPGSTARGMDGSPANEHAWREMGGSPTHRDVAWRKREPAPCQQTSAGDENDDPTDLHQQPRAGSGLGPAWAEVPAATIESLSAPARVETRIGTLTRVVRSDTCRRGRGRDPGRRCR